MKRSLFVAALSAVLLTGGAAAAADDWYVQGNVGGGFASHFGDAAQDGDAGWAASGAVGREFGNGWRADVEALYLGAQNRSSGRGHTEVAGGFVNGYYDFNRGQPLEPFIGAGVGFANVRGADAEDTGFAYQLKAGLAHPFSDNLTGEIAYRFVDVTGLRGGERASAFHGDYSSSAVTVGLRYRFGR
jgi:opacity protein-like surface antigen